MADANESMSALSDSLTVARNHVPTVPANTNGSDGPITPSNQGVQRPVQGEPDIKDKTSAPPQEPTQVPLAELQKERQRRQELENLVKSSNDTTSKLEESNAKLQRDIATLMGQLNGLTQAQANQQVMQPPQEQVPAPDVMLQPQEWSEWAMDRIEQAMDAKLLGLGRDIFNQRMVWSHRNAVAKYGEQMVAEATTAADNAGLRQQAIQDFDPTEWCVNWYQQQQGIKHFQAGPDGRLDPKAYNERFVGQLFQSPEFWQQAVQQPAVQNALTNAMRPPEQQQQPQAQPQQPMQYQQPQAPVPQFQQPQAQPLPQSMAHAPGASNADVIPLPSAMDDLRSSLRRPSSPRAQMGVA